MSVEGAEVCIDDYILNCVVISSNRDTGVCPDIEQIGICRDLLEILLWLAKLVIH